MKLNRVFSVLVCLTILVVGLALFRKVENPADKLVLAILATTALISGAIE